MHLALELSTAPEMKALSKQSPMVMYSWQRMCTWYLLDVFQFIPDVTLMIILLQGLEPIQNVESEAKRKHRAFSG